MQGVLSSFHTVKVRLLLAKMKAIAQDLNLERFSTPYDCVTTKLRFPIIFQGHT